MIVERIERKVGSNNKMEKGKYIGKGKYCETGSDG